MSTATAFPHPLLQPRPPTPPKEHVPTVDDDLGDIIDSLEDSFQVERAINLSGFQKSLGTPQQTPPSSATHINTRSDTSRRTRKVEFSPWSSYHRNSKRIKATPDSAGPIRPLPPSRTLSASKSILKVSNFPSPQRSPATSRPRLCSAHQYNSFAEMLDSVLDALASEERDVRLDAYLTLLRTLGAHKNVPDAELLRPRAPQVAQHILRDISGTNTATNAPDSQLTGEAIKLFCAFIRFGMADALGDDNCSTILKRCIYSLEDINASKATVKHFLLLLAEQKFSTRLMTIERVGRILDILRNIEERYSGNSVAAMRLLIYKRLVEQSTEYMTLRMSSWLDHIFHGMLSSMEDIRSRAVDAGTTAALATGNSTEAAKALTALFAKEGEGNLDYGDYVAGRLMAMLDFKPKGGEKIDPLKLQQARHVPQIWAVALLFFRGRRDKINTWSNLKLWLNVMSQCFNSSDIQTKFHASVAWNRFVYVLMPSVNTEQKTYTMLRQPMTAQLAMKGEDKWSIAIRKYAFGSWCNLLHYALRPNADLPLQDWTRAWDEYVLPLIQTLCKRQDQKTALKVILSMMKNDPAGQPRYWNENRANEPPHVLDVQDLPRLEPRWVRQNITRVLRALEPLLQGSASYLERHSAATLATWRAIMQSVADAGNKEITASRDLKEAVASLVEFVIDVWSTIDNQESLPDLAHYTGIAKAMVEIIGPAQFTEIFLKRKGGDKEQALSFEVVNTPSAHRKRGPIDNALGQIIRFLCTDHHSDSGWPWIAAAKEVVAVYEEGVNSSSNAVKELNNYITTAIAQHKAERTREAPQTELELPGGPPRLSKSPLLRKVVAAPSPLRSGGAGRSKSPFLAPLAQTLRRATPKKLRHEDSQIQFEPIHSSPPDHDLESESQHFTAHQQEVNERQHEEAANIFSDIGVSSPAQILRGPSVNANRLPPRPSSASRMQEKLRSSANEDNEDVERPSTPPLPLPELGMSDDLPGSSPVQSASERRSNASQRSDAYPIPQAHHTLVVDNGFFDIPSSPPREEGQGATKEKAHDSNTHERALHDMEGSTAVEDTMFDTATEVANEIIERNMSSVQNELLENDSAGEEQEGVQESENKAVSPPKDSKLDEHAVYKGAVDAAVALAAVDTDQGLQLPVDQPAFVAPEYTDRSLASMLSSDDPTLSAAQLNAEIEQCTSQQNAVDDSSIPKRSSPTRSIQSSDCGDDAQAINIPVTSSDSQKTTKVSVVPDTTPPKVVDSFVAPTLPASASQQSSRRRGLRRSESVVSEISEDFPQGIKRKRGPGRPPKIAKLQSSDSFVSATPRSGPSRQLYTEHKFYNDNDSDIEEHIFVRSPCIMKVGKKRRTKLPTTKHVHAVAARLFSNNELPSLQPSQRSQQSSPSASTTSSVRSPTPRRAMKAAPTVRRQSSRLSQSSHIILDDDEDATDAQSSQIVTDVDDTANARSEMPLDQPKLMVPQVQVARTPAELLTPGEDKMQLDGAEDSRSAVASTKSVTPSRKRKRDDINDGTTSTPVPKSTVANAYDGSRTPVHSEIQPQLFVPPNSVRNMLSPSSLLRGLRGILEGCRNAVMGSQEEREVDDVLFEIRREVHEAGRRSKRQRTS